MHSGLTNKIKRWLRRHGYDFYRLPSHRLTLRNLEFDLPTIIAGDEPTIFDVGANKGQTIELLLSAAIRPQIFAFEPNPSLAARLREAYGYRGVTVECCALGAKEGKAVFHLMEEDELSSMLSLSSSPDNPFLNTRQNEDIEVPVMSLDQYVATHSIERIALLKIDTQGFDVEVLRGAMVTLERRAVEAVLIEVNFIQMYENQCSFGQIEEFLATYGYGFVNFYEAVRARQVIQWATAFFAKRQ